MKPHTAATQQTGSARASGQKRREPLGSWGSVGAFSPKCTLGMWTLKPGAAGATVVVVVVRLVVVNVVVDVPCVSVQHTSPGPGLIMPSHMQLLQRCFAMAIYSAKAK
mmetsp:Transcript_10423/g.27109  ORF Transcript_10423/g.27109 Transcript_10423/m.27109 type:complete len:108 (+) Transcript_10423:357-680(+)